MRIRPSLRWRFAAAMLLVVTIVSSGFYYAVHQFIEVLETELSDRTLSRELEEFATYYARDPAFSPPHSAGIHSFILRPEDSRDTLPPPLVGWKNEQRAEIKWHGHDYHAGRRDIGDTQLYLMLDLDNVERLEERLVVLAWLFIGAGLMLAALAGTLLSRLVTRPVSRLAELVTQLNPSTRGLKLREHFGDPEIGVIATSIDGYLENLDRYVSREQAFTEDASHELRTPLATIISTTHLLQEERALPERTRGRVLRIHRASAQMQSLIETMLFLARQDGGLAIDRCDLGELLSEVADAHRDEIAEKGLSLRCEILAATVIDAPKGMVLCVLNNLLRNAIQHTRKGHLDLRLEPGRIVVQDTGEGISGKDLPHIFERRYRGTESRGLGLGLHLVKRICDHMGWHVEARNAPGAGACFELYLPVHS